MKKAWLQKDNGKELICFTFPQNMSNYDLYRKVLLIPNIKGKREPFHHWYCPVNVEVIKDLVTWEFNIDNNLKSLISESLDFKEKHFNSDIPELKKELMPFQKEGVVFLEEKNGRALLAHEMGLGKTIMSLAWLQKHPELRPAVIICPASLKLNWQREANMWLTEPDTEILNSTTPYPTKGKLFIINYDILNYWIEILRKTHFKAVIIDESTYIKESTARRTKAIKRLVKGIKHVICLSGTPVLNRPAEIYNTIKILNPDLFVSAMYFRKRYCNLHYNGFGWDYSGASHIPELHQILTKTVMLRKLKKDVLSELPDKLYSFVPIALSNRSHYLNAEKNFIEWVRTEKGDEAAFRAKRAETFARIEGLKQLALKGKTDESIAWIRDFINTENKLVVFCIHHEMIDRLKNEFSKVCVKFDGRDTIKQKQNAVDLFQNEERIKLFIGNISAAGVGINLTASSNVAFLEYPFSPSLLNQAIDRCHRIGQKDNVNVYYLLSQNTIEERIAKILDKKKLMTDSLMDGKETETESLITELIKIYL